MNFKEITDGLIESLKEREFIYESKYGGFTDGVIESAFFTQSVTSKEHKTLKTVKGPVKLPTGQLYFRFILKIKSTTGIVYDYDEIYIKSKNKTIFGGDE